MQNDSVFKDILQLLKLISIVLKYYFLLNNIFKLYPSEQVVVLDILFSNSLCKMVSSSVDVLIVT